MASDFLELLVEKLNDECGNISEDILDGVPTMERYNHLVGYRRGLLTAIDIVKDIAKKIEQE